MTLYNDSLFTYLPGVAYDFNHNVLYWTTASQRVVQLSLDGEGNEPTDVELSSSLGSIGVDYIGQRVYWIEDSSEVSYSYIPLRVGYHCYYMSPRPEDEC